VDEKCGKKSETKAIRQADVDNGKIPTIEREKKD
jgi:hypothetical protein